MAHAQALRLATGDCSGHRSAGQRSGLVSGQRSAVSGQRSGQQIRPCHRPALRSCTWRRFRPPASRSRRRLHGATSSGHAIGHRPSVSGQRPAASHHPCYQLRLCHRPAPRPAAGDGGQVLPPATGHRSAGQVLHLVKVPAIGQPLQAKASRCHQLRPCHRSAVSGQRSATMLAPPAQVLPSATGQRSAVSRSGLAPGEDSGHRPAAPGEGFTVPPAQACSW